jgi:hypothetical protein
MMGHYTETGYWQDSDRGDAVADPYARAAEILARDVERYLRRDKDADGSPWPGYHNEDFLNWAVARYDNCKNGSGQAFQAADYDFSAPHDNVLPGYEAPAPVEIPPAEPIPAPVVEGGND